MKVIASYAVKGGVGKTSAAVNIAWLAAQSGERTLLWDLDPQAAEDVMALLRRLATEDGIAVLVVLHQPELAERYSDRIVGIRGGQMAFDLPVKQICGSDVAGLYMSKDMSRAA